MKKVRICVLTATRAEFGLLKPIISEMEKRDNLDVRIVATGMHLSPEFGMTYTEIEEAGFHIDKKIEMLLSSDSTVGVAKSMGLAMIGFADYFNEIKPDLVFIIADRYEALAVASVAMCERIPIIHYMGGETSEGAIDECVRHSITKMASLHFCNTEAYRKRIIQLGENPDKVYNVGSTGVENIKKLPLMTEDEIRQCLEVPKGKKYVVTTFHPVTLENDSAEGQIRELLEACVQMQDIFFVITKSNADAAGRIVNKYADDYSQKYGNIKTFDSLGSLKYLSALKYATFVLGNSSSGLLEVPSFAVPTVNIGDRQKGRIRAESVIDCEPFRDCIILAMEKALSKSFRNGIMNVKNPYEGIDTSVTIVNKIEEAVEKNSINLKKPFYNVDFNA